jgi:hypothetical protein
LPKDGTDKTDKTYEDSMTGTEVAARAEILPPFDYGALPAEHAELAREAVAFIDSRQRGMASAAIEIGQKLNAVKAALEHGQFTAWLSASFTMTARTAQNYMQAANALGNKSETVSYLPVSTVYEIARAPEPIREKVMEELETAPKPVPAKEVSNLIWQAQREAKEAARLAKMSPAERKRRKAQREKENAEYDRRRIERGKQEAEHERAVVRLAELLLSKLGEDAAEAAALLRKTGVHGETLAYRLTESVYGKSIRNFSSTPREKEEWNEWLGELESGGVPAGLFSA